MKTISIPGAYDIFIGAGLLSEAGERIRAVSDAQRACIVADSNVRGLYADRVRRSLETAGFEASVYEFPAGERHKTLETVAGMLNCFAARRLTRADLVVALGGGVCGDLAGFAAAVYLRGVDFVQIPTTLLAQIDSSVGGKTGCDLPAGKNLAGAFHQPRLVLIDPDTLSTLPDAYLRDGMGEAVKYGCIRSRSLFERLEAEPPFSSLEDLIYDCVRIKADIVARDPHEQGERMLLNFGHTLGHALERYENFTGISHGAAVGVGMVLVTRAAERAGLCAPGCAGRIAALLQKYDLPSGTDAPLEVLCEHALADKKRRADSIHLVLLREIGESFVHTVKSAELERFLREGAL